MKYVFACAVALSVSAATHAQTTEDWKQPTVCEKEAITLQVTGLKRIGPGRLSLSFQVENAANLPVTIGSSLQVFDDSGNEWKGHGSSASPNKYPPGIKVASTITFSRDIGGNDSKVASLSSRVLVHVVGQAKNLGTCAWTVKNIPIQ